jgi:hypothetical protein
MVKRLLPPPWRTPQIIYLCWTIVLPAAIGFLTALLIRSDVFLFLFLIPLLGIGLLIETCIILVLVISSSVKLSPATQKHLRRHSGIFLFLAVSGIVNYFVGPRILDSDARATIAYCENVIPRIESYASQQGQYPETLSQIQNLPHPPRFSRVQCIYDHNDQGYRVILRYPNPFGEDLILHQSP